MVGTRDGAGAGVTAGGLSRETTVTGRSGFGAASLSPTPRIDIPGVASGCCGRESLLRNQLTARIMMETTAARMITRRAFMSGFWGRINRTEHEAVQPALGSDGFV